MSGRERTWESGTRSSAIRGKWRAGLKTARGTDVSETIVNVGGTVYIQFGDVRLIALAHNHIARYFQRTLSTMHYYSVCTGEESEASGRTKNVVHRSFLSLSGVVCSGQKIIAFRYAWYIGPAPKEPAFLCSEWL
jgi:hypothetical protein